MTTEQKNKFKIGQKVWYFNNNFWKPIQDRIYDYKNGLYDLESGGFGFEENELFTSASKCWGERKNL